MTGTPDLLVQSGLTRRRAGNVAWKIDPAWEPLILGVDGLRWSQWRRDGRVTVVKHGPHRTVYRIDIAQRSFFLKHYRCGELLRAVRHLFRRCASRREWQRAQELAARQIPTVHAVAIGEQYRAGLVHDNFFVSEAVADSLPLDDFEATVLPQLSGARRSRIRRRLCVKLAALCATMHRAGVLHNDFHAGNILIRVDPGDEVYLTLIDLPYVRCHRTLSRRQCYGSLAMLGSGLSSWTSRAERWRFWRAYLDRRPEMPISDPRKAAAEIERLALARSRHVIRSRDRRSLRTNRDYFAMRLPGGMGHAVRSLPQPQLAGLICDPERMLCRFIARPSKLSHRSVVVEAELELDAARQRVAWKRYRAKTWWKALLARFRRSRARRDWWLGHALLARGIATARPLALVEPRRTRGWPVSYLATQWIDNAKNLHVYGWELADRGDDERRRRCRQVTQSLGRLIGRMHAWNIAHRDLKGCNLLVLERDEGVETMVIDLDGVRFRGRVGAPARAQNLARLAASMEAHPWLTRTDRLRFLRAYFDELRLPLRDWKPLWRATERHVPAHTRRIIRRGEPIA